MRIQLSAINLLVFLLLGEGRSNNGANIFVKTNGNASFVFSLHEEKSLPNMSRFSIDENDILSFGLWKTDVHAINIGSFAKMTNLEHLEIVGNKKLLGLPPFMFKENAKLTTVSIRDNAIKHITRDCFSGGFQNEKLHTTVDLRHNHLSIFPVFPTAVPAIKTLVLDGNPIMELRRSHLSNVTALETLAMTNCDLKELKNFVFADSSNLHDLDLSNNPNLNVIEENVFAGARQLKHLSLANTGISWIPSAGLSSLTHLDLGGTPNILEIPDGVLELRRLSVVQVDIEHRYLCCAFDAKRASLLHEIDLETTMQGPPSTGHEVSTTPTMTGRTTLAATSESSTPMEWPDPFPRLVFAFGETETPPENDQPGEGFLPPGFSSNVTALTPERATHDPFVLPTFLPHTVSHAPVITRNHNNSNDTDFVKQRYELVQCLPSPDALRPCDDIMGDRFLTGISFVVAVVALLSNGVVFGILISSRRSFTVTKLLVANLAFADLCLGLYLLVLVCASLTTSGRYYNYVRRWQFDGGCDVAGFLAVFASQLSMLVLLVITIERYLAIVYAMYLNKRLTFGKTKWMITVCWLFAFIIAILPVAGVNSYKDVAICLPFRSSTSGDIFYLALLLTVNCVAFAAILFCYIRIYASVRSSHGQQNNAHDDALIAKRMAVLVVTDFLCWSPIALFGLLAACGYSSTIGIDVKNSKYLLVIFFPLNSICNPILYSFLTRSFRHDLVLLLGRIGMCKLTVLRYRDSVFPRQPKRCATKGSHVNQAISLHSLEGRPSH